MAKGFLWMGLKVFIGTFKGSPWMQLKGFSKDVAMCLPGRDQKVSMDAIKGSP